MKISARYVAAFLTLALCLAPVYDLAGRSKKKKEKTLCQRKHVVSVEEARMK